ncbi:zinc ribbon domain-containing protein [Nostoc sp. ChiQUE01b]|uniref:zinc ribbon domain-containing protein n=1 Tax=Nostoc sp. ChiQUE01b TaxID=3075376 RepID=UPI002AD2DFCF|nr:zinc ribbon domain-containing protein [Nostoc sp. ChiQUE01b]
MFAINRELKLNNKECSLMLCMAGFKGFVYNYGLNLIIASWDFNHIQTGDAKRIDAIKKVYQQMHYGTKVEIVDRWFPSSKTCSKFSHIQSMNLSGRIFFCQKCDRNFDRDESAAMNLKNAPSKAVS